MEILKVYYLNQEDKLDHIKEFAISSWYCKPAILSALAWKLNRGLIFTRVSFLTCSKYGCRQFCPAISKAYPVHNVDLISYKKDLPWIVIEFNDFAYDNVKD